MRRVFLRTDLKEGHPTEKLVWLYLVLNGRGAYSVRLLAEELGMDKNSTRTALQALKAKGLIREITPPQGRRQGEYEAVTAAAT